MRQGVLRSEQARPEALDAARDAARRSGLTLGQWLDAVVTDAVASQPVRRDVRADTPRTEPHSVQARLQEIAERLDKLGASGEPPLYRRPPVSDAPDRLASALDRLSRRLDGLLPEGEARDPHAPPHARKAGSEPDPAMEMDRAVAEIAARQRMLNEDETAPAAIAVDLSGLEQQLKHITEQIESLRRPCAVEDAVAALRGELAEIYRTINDALPRRALETLEAEVRALAQRIDATRERNADASAIAGLERGLVEVRDALHALTPAENLTSVTELIKALAHKIDRLAVNGADPAAMQQIELAVSKLREVADGAASGEALAALAAEVHTIGAKVDRLLSADAYGPVTDDLSARIEALSHKLDRTPADGGLPRFEHLEAQINQLVDQLETARAQPQSFGSIERSLSDLAIQIGEARVSAVEAAERAARAVAREVAAGAGGAAEFDDLKRNLSELRVIQSASDERTQGTLEAVHATLEKLVNRLGSLESELREEVRALAAARGQPVAKETKIVPAAGLAAAPATAAPPSPKSAAHQREARPIDPSLPADHPLEPGSVRGRAALSADRPAAASGKGSSEGDQNTAQRGDFIAAARRAAQAAQSLEQEKELLLDRDDIPAERNIFARHRRPFLIGMGAFLLIIGIAHLLVNMLGGSPMRDAPRPPKDTTAPALNAPQRESRGPARTNTLNADSVTSPSIETTGSTPPRQGPAALTPQSIAPNAPGGGVAGSIELQNVPALASGGSFDLGLSSGLSMAPSPTPAAGEHGATATARVDPTGASAPSDKLPVSIGAPTLRTAAENGDAAAEYEIAIRYAEGRGVSQSFEQAARWFERAANKGLAPAQYRLGSLYEKGQGVKKDVEASRRLYTAAAEKGNAKAMHNLAVLYAEGIDGKPDYRSASSWFRRAAERGVPDSQYNLGILYARGIGVEQNLAESYKWFALAAQQGDQDAAKKRDDVAQRIDAQSLVAAKLAVQTFAPQPQPSEAVEVKAAGGDERPNASRPAKPKPLGSRKSGAT